MKTFSKEKRMRAIISLLVLVILFSFTLVATAATKIANLEPNTVIKTNTGHLVAVFDEGVVVQNPKVGDIGATDCIDFCGEVCDTGQVDTCFCGSQSFPCEDLGPPPVCEIKR